VLLEVLRSHPALSAYGARLRASRLRTHDRMRRPNPELELDVGGSGPFDELVGGVEAVLPLRRAGEAAAVRDAGAAGIAVIDAECRNAAAGLLAAAAASWADLLAAADRAELADEELEVARGFLEHARRRAEMAMAGDLPVLQSEILVQRAVARGEAADADAGAARARLAALLGLPADAPAPEPDSTAALRRAVWELLASLPADPGDRARGGAAAEPAAAPCGAGREPPGGDDGGAAATGIAGGGAPAGGADPRREPPALAAARARLELARRETEVVRASRRLAPRVGVRAERDTGGELELFGIAGVAVPLFSRGAEAVAAAEAEALAARFELVRDSLSLTGELAAALAEHRRAAAALERLEEGILPMAAELEASARANAERGAAGFVLWLEARRSYLELRDGAVDLRSRMAASALAIRRATADFDVLLAPPAAGPPEPAVAGPEPGRP
jgi:cobalt-zinc-cadmium efflux system outer membrane protein